MEENICRPRGRMRLVKNVMSYADCLNICSNEAGCVAVVYANKPIKPWCRWTTQLQSTCVNLRRNFIFSQKCATVPICATTTALATTTTRTTTAKTVIIPEVSVKNRLWTTCVLIGGANWFNLDFIHKKYEY